MKKNKKIEIKLGFSDIKPFLIESLKQCFINQRINLTDSDWNKFDKGAYIITDYVRIGKKSKMENLIGKAIQIRKEQGAFGSDLVLLRLQNNDLTNISNSGFYRIPSFYRKQIDLLDKFFINTSTDDPDKSDYTINKGKEPKKGFIVVDKKYKQKKLKNKIKTLEEEIINLKKQLIDLK